MLKPFRKKKNRDTVFQQGNSSKYTWEKKWKSYPKKVFHRLENVLFPNSLYETSKTLILNSALHIRKENYMDIKVLNLLKAKKIKK